MLTDPCHQVVDLLFSISAILYFFCAVLALDSWNYCSGEQVRQSNICKIVQPTLYSWAMYIIKTNKVLPPYVKLPATRWHLGFYFLLINEAMQGKHWDEAVGLSGLLSRTIVPTV